MIPTIAIEPQAPAAEPAWVDRASCASHANPELWYAKGARSIRKAKAVCARCPVQADCLAEARERGDRFGVRAGLTPIERDHLHDFDEVERHDGERVLTALAGVRVQLSTRERDSVAIVAVLTGTPPRVWAHVCGIQRKRALELLRDAEEHLASSGAAREYQQLAARHLRNRRWAAATEGTNAA